jgi:hypothetical protein
MAYGSGAMNVHLAEIIYIQAPKDIWHPSIPPPMAFSTKMLVRSAWRAVKRAYKASKEESEMWDEWKAWDDHVRSLEREGICPLGLLLLDDGSDEPPSYEDVERGEASSRYSRSRTTLIVSP